MSYYLATSNHSIEDLKKDFFSGMLIFNDSIVIGKSGWDDFRKSKGFDERLISEYGDGRYFLAARKGNKIYVRVDTFGSDAIFIYRDGCRWGISNSLKLLTEECKRLGWEISLNPNVLASMFMNGSIGRQLISLKTPVNQIKLVSTDTYLVCDLEKKTITENKLEKKSEKIIDYDESILTWFNKWRSIITSLAITSEEDISLDLSGGIDSRMLFGLVNKTPVKNKFKVFSQPHKKNDFFVAESLCEKFSFSLDSRPPNWKKLPVDLQYDSYCLGNLGFYNLPVTPPLFLNKSSIIKINGVGGENVRNFYLGSGNEWLRKLNNLLPDELKGYREGVEDIFLSSFESFDIDPEDPNGMMKHYRNLRSRILGGRNSYESHKFNLVTPLTDSLLTDLNDRSGGNNGLEIYRDILILGGGEELIAHPFDDDKKKFDFSFVNKSGFLSFSHIGSNLREYKVFYESKDFEEVDIDFSKGSKSTGLVDRILFEMETLSGSELIFDEVPSSFLNLYASGNWSTSGGRKGVIETLTWHSLFKMYQMSFI